MYRNSPPRSVDDWKLAVIRTRLVAWFRYRTYDPSLSEDLAQESLLVIFQKLKDGSIRQQDRLIAFAYGVARNVLTSHRRRTCDAIETRVDFDELESGQPSAVDLMEQLDTRREIRFAIDCLDHRDRQLLEGRYLLEEDLWTLQRRFGVSHGAIEVAVHRARSKLGRILDGRKI
jgi:RNA polymerase sigma factor (sigma-70 family)